MNLMIANTLFVLKRMRDHAPSFIISLARVCLEMNQKKLERLVL